MSKLIVGITGGIGTGKSTVADYLAHKSYPVISADQVAREIVEPGSPTLQALAREFGQEIIAEDGSLKRKVLADIAFGDPVKKARLDELTHGTIIEIMMTRARESQEALVFLDVPLLFESGMDKMVDKIWVVDADLDLRVARIQARDGLSTEEIRKRLEFQLDSQKRRQMADLVLENDGAREDLYREVDLGLGGLKILLEKEEEKRIGQKDINTYEK